MKLEAGMYVRTKNGIFKIRKITKDLAYWKHEKRLIELDRNIPEYNYRFVFYKDESIFKGAKFKDNIMDLIEVGDYVNGFPVIHKENDILKCGLLVQFKENDIKSIVTKEMYSSVEYRVEAN